MPNHQPRPKTLPFEGVPTLFPNDAGTDSGADEIVVAVPSNRSPEPVRAFRTCTPDVVALVDWRVLGATV